ncbi:MAG: DUF3488 domain-containing protein, partial [Actinomycetota bacterium]|nr:DUF3488 domain-containing protein [Actinomycetota bacterium]
MGSEARARIGLGGLLLVVLYSFGQVFATAEYAGPAMLGSVIAIVVAMAFRRLGISVLVTLLSSIAAMSWYVMLIFQAKQTWFGLPSVTAARGALRAIDRAYAQSHVDYAPVPTRPGYVILIVMVMWLVAVVGEVATFRWRRPLAAAIAPIAIFAFVLVVGTNEASVVLVPLFLAALLTYWGLEAAHRLRSWGRWVATWRGRQPIEPESVTGALARRMGATCVVVALAAPLFLPSLGDGLLAWRNAVGDGGFGGGEGSSGAVDPLVSIVPELLDQTDTELFRVRANQPAYWKLVTLSNFDGETWTPASEPNTPTANGALASDELPPPEPGLSVEQNYEIVDLEGDALPAASLPADVRFTGDSLERQDDLNFDVNTGDLELEGSLDEDLTYQVFSTIPKASFQTMIDAVPGVAGGEFTELPPHDPEIDALAREWTRGAGT